MGPSELGAGKRGCVGLPAARVQFWVLTLSPLRTTSFRFYAPYRKAIDEGQPLSATEGADFSCSPLCAPCRAAEHPSRNGAGARTLPELLLARAVRLRALRIGLKVIVRWLFMACGQGVPYA